LKVHAQLEVGAAAAGGEHRYTMSKQSGAATPRLDRRLAEEACQVCSALIDWCS
jgi:hypothetical protein